MASVATSSYAAGLAWVYENNSKTDWFLPSKDELDQLWANKSAFGMFAPKYWSSSEAGPEDDAYNAWNQDFASGGQFFNSKFNTYYVRPVRAF